MVFYYLKSKLHISKAFKKVHFFPDLRYGRETGGLNICGGDSLWIKGYEFRSVMCLYGSKAMNSVVARWDLQNLSPLSAQKTPKLPLNLSAYARNKVDIFPTVMCLYGSKAMNSRFLLDAGKRFFHGNGFQVQPHTALLPAEDEDSISFWKDLLQEPKIKLFCASAYLTLHFCRLERIPYSKRYHWVVGSGSSDWEIEAEQRKWGDRMLEELEKKTKGSIVPPNTPQSIRADSILKEIVEAMHSSLRLQNSGKWKITRFTTEHLDGMQWKVMVVKSKKYDIGAYLTNGMILMSTGLLEKLKSDAEVATLLGHEVAHGLARHVSEEVMMCIGIITFLPMLMFIPHSIPLALVFSFCSRRREMEADYIGMMLMASAGYDPQLVPTFYESLDDTSRYYGKFATHPSGHKRAKKLKEPKVMEQAMAIYNEVTSARGVRSSI